MAENEPDPAEEKRAWLRELLARSESHNTRVGIFAPKPPSTDDNRSN